MMVVVADQIRNILKLFPNIKPKEAALKLEIPYSKSFLNNFYRVKNTPEKPLPTTKREKKKEEIIPPLIIPTDKLSADMLEGMIITLLKEEVTEKRLQIAVDFYTKLKLSQGEKIEALDMEKFLHVIEGEGEGSSPI
jgi:hypothetical protein